MTDPFVPPIKGRFEVSAFARSASVNLTFDTR